MKYSSLIILNTLQVWEMTVVLRETGKLEEGLGK